MRMRAMVLERVGEPLVLRELPVPKPNANQVLIRVRACGVCRTDLHVVDGELPRPKLPLILGHEIVGEVVQLGAAVQGLQVGQRVGVPWLGHTCGACRFCEAGRENLCEFAQFTGYTLDGGYAEYTVADARYVFPLPDAYDDVAVAPLLCAGLIGYRSYRIARQGMLGDRLGIYGFGAAAHILIQIARREGMRVFAFTRPGDFATQDYARNLGAWWAGGSDQMPPEPLDGAILFAPVGALVPVALRAVEKGGIVVCGGIHMSDIPSFPYSILWGERTVRSVANLTRADGEEFFEKARQFPIETHTTTFPLEQANEALAAARGGTLHGAAVLVMQ
ncbi:MAG: zinc-dependent alcohol dehydrogenase family protein [Fimbriimonadales bacterium]|nr:zinc-dependent alcohol dehydrogenase family protein [Fimbriimonadales bacterium]